MNQNNDANRHIREEPWQLIVCQLFLVFFSFFNFYMLFGTAV